MNEKLVLATLVVVFLLMYAGCSVGNTGLQFVGGIMLVMLAIYAVLPSRKK